MRWSVYLESRPPEEAAALINDLRVGYGTPAFMVRQLARDGELRDVVGTLDRAEAALDRTYRRLAMQPERSVLPPERETASGQPWQTYLADRPDRGGPALLARLQDVVAAARVAGEAIATDGTVEELAIHLRAALDQLRGLRGAMRPAN